MKGNPGEMAVTWFELARVEFELLRFYSVYVSGNRDSLFSVSRHKRVFTQEKEIISFLIGQFNAVSREQKNLVSNKL